MDNTRENFSPREDRPRWVWIWPLLALALALRIFVAFFSAAPLHPDELLQYLEQGHRWAFGYGVVPWEYSLGIRSWAIPIFIGELLKVADLIGLSEPWSYIPFVKIVFSLVSLSLPLGMYALGREWLSETGARIAFLFGCFWGHFFLYAHKPMPGVLIMYTLVWLAVLMVRPAGAGRLVVMGILAGLTAVIRFQVLPVLGILAIWGIARFGWRILVAYLAAIAVIMAAGLLDYWTWGGFLFSFTENYELNFKYNFSAEFFGSDPIHFYAVNLILETGGIILISLPGLLLLPKRSWPVFLSVIVGVAALHIPEHKEFRFVIWALPFAFIAISAFLVFVLERSRQIIRLAGMMTLAGSLAIGGAFAAVRAGVTPSGFLGQDWRLYSEIEQVYFRLASEPDLTGVEFLSPDLKFWEAGGYYYLHRQVPIYFWSWHNWWPEAEREDFRRHVSHVVTSADEIPPEGFAEDGEIGRFTIWRATTMPQDMPAGGYDPRTPRRKVLQEIGAVPEDLLYPSIKFIPFPGDANVD